LKKPNLDRIIAENIEAYGIDLSREEISRSTTFLGLLLRWNRSINLTGVTDMGNLVRHHLFEGFYAEKLLPCTVSGIADIGSGAGFPGIPMHILQPSRNTFLIEKNLKKATFLSTALRELSLSGRVINRPAETVEVWSKIELATVRALKLNSATLQKLWEAGSSLMILEGKESQLTTGSWKIENEERLPFSENRWIRLYSPQCFT